MKPIGPIAGLAAAALAALPTTALASDGGGGRGNDRGPDHIFVIMMENHGFSQLIGNTADAPFINRLARRSVVATSYYGVTHPSLTNYLALFSGDFQGIWDDCKAGAAVFCAPEEFVPGSGDGTAAASLTDAQIASASATPHLFSGRNLVDQLEAHGRSWKAYMEDLPSAGAQDEYAPVIGGTTVKLYAQKHDPFMYFSDINYAGSARLARIVPAAGNLDADLASRHVPDLVWISPNQCHDMHGVSPSSAALIGLPLCGYPDSGLDHGAIQLGDAYLRDTVGKITSSWTWRHTRSSLAIVWDEDDYTGFEGTGSSPVGKDGVVLGGGHTLAMVVSSDGDRGRTVATPANHYSMLAGIERIWHLGCLANACSVPRGADLGSMFAG